MLQKETPAVAVRSLTERGEELRHRLQEEPSRAVFDDYHIANAMTTIANIRTTKAAPVIISFAHPSGFSL